MYVIVTILIFAHIQKNLLYLKIEIARSENRDQTESLNSSDENSSPSYGLQRSAASEKFNMFQSFRIIMVTYVILLFIHNLVEFIFLSNLLWVSFLLLETLEFSMFVCIGYTFRLRNE